MCVSTACQAHRLWSLLSLEVHSLLGRQIGEPILREVHDKFYDTGVFSQGTKEAWQEVRSQVMFPEKVDT